MKDIARKSEVARVEQSPFGKRYVVDGVLHAPDGGARRAFQLQLDPENAWVSQ